MWVGGWVGGSGARAQAAIPPPTPLAKPWPGSRCLLKMGDNEYNTGFGVPHDQNLFVCTPHQNFGAVSFFDSVGFVSPGWCVVGLTVAVFSSLHSLALTVTLTHALVSIPPTPQIAPLGPPPPPPPRIAPLGPPPPTDPPGGPPPPSPSYRGGGGLHREFFARENFAPGLFRTVA